MTAEELGEMLERAASNGREISREDFYNIMVKKTFWLTMQFIIYIINNKMIKLEAHTFHNKNVS